MTDSNKSAPPFNFESFGIGGNPGTSSGQPSSDASKPADGPFGAGPNPPTTSGMSLFGNTSTAGGSSPFGAASGPSQTPAFGSGTGSTSFAGANKQSGLLFGQTASQSNQKLSGTASPNVFPGFSTPNKAAETTGAGQGQTSNVFGEAFGAGNAGGLFNNSGSNAASLGQTNTITPTSKSTTNLFGNSTTPAGPPPNTGTGVSGSNIFNKPAVDSTNLFGNKNQSSTSQSTLPSGTGKLTGFSFESSKPPDTGSTTSSTQPASIFGSTPSTGASDIFGKKPAQSGGNLFQNINKAQDSGPMSQQPPNEAAKAPSLFSLDGKSSAGTSSAPKTAAPPFSFPKATQAQSSEPTNPAASSSAALGGFNIFNKPPSSAASQPSTSAPLFSSLGKTQDKASASTSAEAPGTTASTSSTPTLTSTLFSNAGKSATAFVTSQAPSQATSSGAPQTSGTLGASIAGPAPPAQSRLKNKSMDDIITRWASDLSKYQREFQAQAEKVATWDRMLVENSEKIQKLYGSTLEAERATTEVERQLTAVETDQTELAQWLDYYEKEVDSMISSTFGQDGGLSGPDQERERTSGRTFFISITC